MSMNFKKVKTSIFNRRSNMSMLLPCMMRMLLLWNIGRKGIIFLMEAVALLVIISQRFCIEIRRKG